MERRSGSENRARRFFFGIILLGSLVLWGHRLPYHIHANLDTCRLRRNRVGTGGCMYLLPGEVKSDAGPHFDLLKEVGCDSTNV